jgi:hypothetical protein
LNKYYIQDDSAEEVIEEFNDVDGRGVPPKRYVWKESKGKHATKILKEHGVDDLGFEKYSNLLVLIVGVNNRTCRLLLDTGSEVDVISTDWVAKFKDRLNLVDEDVVLQLAADDVVAEVKKKAKGVRLDLFPQSSSCKYSTKTDMLIMNTGNNKFDGIIGIKTMAKLGINVTIPRFSEAAAAAEKEDNENKKRGYVLTNNVVEDDKDLKSSIQHMIMSNQFIRKSDWTTMKNGVIDFTLTEEQLREAYRTNTNYVSLAFFDAVDEQVQKWMQEGVIEVNNENTPINLPLLAIKQNNTDGSLRKVRVCVDFRQLNKLVSMDSYTIPKFNELHSMLVGCNYFTVIDLESGYNQVMVAERSRKYTCFRWRGIQYRFRGTPFGLNFLPSQFNRMVSHHLMDIPGVIVYIDDIIIASKTMKSMNGQLKKFYKDLVTAR